jgi:hypothetical protein
MPVTTKEHLTSIRAELDRRYRHLADCLKGRPLEFEDEGAQAGHVWINANLQEATMSTVFEIGLAMRDLKVIMKEIARLK